MRFEERELKEYAEPVTADTLKAGHVYFAVQFADEELRIPIVEPLIFLGRDIAKDQHNQLCFQNYESYVHGIRFDTASENERHFFQVAEADAINHIFEYERALDVLLLCALNRRKAKID